MFGSGILKRPDFSPKTPSISGTESAWESLRTCKNESIPTQHSRNALLLMTRRGFTSLTCKLVNKLRSGAFQLNRNQKNHSEVVQKSKSCWLFSLTIAMLCTRNSCRKVNKECYLSVVRRLREQIQRKGPNLWKEFFWIKHHINAPSHGAIIVNEFWTIPSTNTIEEPPYLPDMAPAEFFLFPKFK
jgi:hypothetical protein